MDLVCIKSKSRIYELDIAKAICIISVILGHSFQQNQCYRLMQAIYCFHMPLLFMISGYFISEKKEIKEFITNRFFRLIIPYWICCVGYILLYLAHAIQNGESVWREVVNRVYICFYGSGADKGTWSLFGEKLLFHDEIGMLWFLLALFWGSIIVRIIVELKFSWLYSIVISLGGIILSHYFVAPFSLLNGLSVVFWIYSGYLFKKKYFIFDDTNKFIIHWYLIPTALVLYVISIIGGGTRLYENTYQLGIIDIAAAYLISYCVIALSSLINKSVKLAQILNAVGRNTMQIYAGHFLVLNTYIVPKIIRHIFTEVSVISVSFYCVIFIALSFAMAFIIKKIKVIDRFFE